MYIDAVLDRRSNKIKVVERVNGERIFKEYPAEYVFYYEHAAGTHKSIFGHPLKRYSSNDHKAFKRELERQTIWCDPKKKKQVFESDINPVFRGLANHYSGAELPSPNVAFFDIETALYPERGYAPTTDPFAEITAITVYLKWVGRLVTLALCPPSLNIDVARDMCEKFDDTFVFDDEGELLRTFLLLIEDVDILSGWNSEGFDIPYTINRIARVLNSDATRDMCLWNERPRTRTMVQFKREVETYDLVGRVHLDYLALYQKHNQQQLHTYRLDYVGEIEVGENKVVYEGTLDKLWREDFVKFIEYNRQDVMLLQKIDEKKKFIALANQVAHANCVPLKTTMGSVALVEQAIINEMHLMGFVVPDRKRTLEERSVVAVEDDEDDDEFDPDADEKTPVCGAYVADPKKGLHDYIGCCDINSLYPSAIRALNMSPETIVGQFRQDETNAYIEKRARELSKGKRAEAWNGVFGSLEFEHILARDGAPLTLDFEDGTSKTKSAREWHDYLFNPKNNLCVTANGTVFSTARDGMIPLLLAKWYAERKQMQAKEADYTAILGNKAEISDAFALSIEAAEEVPHDEADVLLKMIKAENAAGVKAFIKAHDLILVDGLLHPANDETKKRLKLLETFWNQRQQSRKILLNSLYGALLNEGLRFYDARLGQSTTLSGRAIARHMNATINEAITGVYDYKGDAIIYADTDSSYFSAYEYMKDRPEYADIGWTKEGIIDLYDGIAKVANDSFAEFMMRTFNTSFARGQIIRAGRELIGSRGLFIKKKKYALLMYEKEGVRLDVEGKPGKLKAMGLDLKRADTPKYMQNFLERLLMDILTGRSQTEMYEDVKTFRRDFVDKPAWEKGTPKKVTALTDYRERDYKARTQTITEALKKGQKGKVNMPGHVRASINWNALCEVNKDLYSKRIGDGDKIVVCKMTPNVMQMDSIAYPIDEMHLPAWFKELPFDHAAMQHTIIDKKLLNLVGVLNWDLGQTKDVSADEFFIFN